MCRKRTLGKIPPWVKVSRCRGKSATRLAYKACFKGSVERNMEPTLGQNVGMQMRLTGHNDNTLQCNFNEPREGKLGGFSFLESLKNTKEDSTGVPFSKVV
jgi:hypothetical protein